MRIFHYIIQVHVRVLHRHAQTVCTRLSSSPGAWVRAILTLNRAFSSWAWLIFITCCGNRILYAESSKLGKITSEILNDMQLILRSYKYLNICNPPLKMNG